MRQQNWAPLGLSLQRLISMNGSRLQESEKQELGVQDRSVAPGGPVLETYVESCKERLEAKIDGAISMQECEEGGMGRLLWSPGAERQHGVGEMSIFLLPQEHKTITTS